MVEYALTEDPLVGMLARSRLKQYEQDHRDCSIYLSDQKGMWEIRFTYREGDRKRGTAYISAPDASGWIARFRWPVEGKADIDRLEYVRTGGIEGFLLAALNFEIIGHH